MKAISAKPTKTLQQETYMVCADNSGAKIVKLIAVYGYKGKKRRHATAGIGDKVQVVVKKGKPDMRKKVEKAVVVRVKKEYRRADGTRIKFEDNAVVLIDDKGLPKASEIKGAVAKEVGERWPKIASLAPVVV